MLTPKAFVKMGLDMGDSRFTAAKSIGQPLGDEGKFGEPCAARNDGPASPQQRQQQGQLPTLLLCLATDMDFKRKGVDARQGQRASYGPDKGHGGRGNPDTGKQEPGHNRWQHSERGSSEDLGRYC